MFDYSELASEAVKVLDEYHFSEVIFWAIRSGCRDLYSLQEALSDYYRNDCVGFEEIAEAWENLTLDEFAEYLSTRYGQDGYVRDGLQPILDGYLGEVTGR